MFIEIQSIDLIIIHAIRLNGIIGRLISHVPNFNLGRVTCFTKRCRRLNSL
jgi:hypothetical protein